VGNNTSGGGCAGAIDNVSGVNFATDSSYGASFTQVPSAQINPESLQVNPPETTTTHALPGGSVVIDAITDCTDSERESSRRDQRGVARSQGAGCDAGELRV